MVPSVAYPIHRMETGTDCVFMLKVSQKDDTLGHIITRKCVLSAIDQKTCLFATHVQEPMTSNEKLPHDASYVTFHCILEKNGNKTKHF